MRNPGPGAALAMPDFVSLNPGYARRFVRPANIRAARPRARARRGGEREHVKTQRNLAAELR
jgi:hypothetical protein